MFTSRNQQKEVILRVSPGTSLTTTAAYAHTTDCSGPRNLSKHENMNEACLKEV